MPVQQFVCLTAGQRSGTTALRSLISETGKFADLGEIFDTAIIGEPHSFFGFCRENRIGFADILSGPDADALCKKYFARLREVAAGRHLLFDVKFNSWGEIRMPWTFMHQEPYFLKQLKWMRAKLIFIWRRDLVGAVISDRLSDSIGKWHNLSSQDVTAPVRLDPEKLAERAKLLCLSEAYFFETLKPYPGALLVSYEALFDADGKLASATAGKISDLVGEKLTIPAEGLYRRSKIDKYRAVENYDEVARAVQAVCDRYRDPVLARSTAI
jgi:hypothetical protein